MPKLCVISGVILYRIQSFLSPQIDLNFRHLFSCDTIGILFEDNAKVGHHIRTKQVLPFLQFGTWKIL